MRRNIFFIKDFFRVFWERCRRHFGPSMWRPERRFGRPNWVRPDPLHCTMLPLSTKSCLKLSKFRPILYGQFCHAIPKNICLNVLGSKQPCEILLFVHQTTLATEASEEFFSTGTLSWRPATPTASREVASSSTRKAPQCSGPLTWRATSNNPRLSTSTPWHRELG